MEKIKPVSDEENEFDYRYVSNLTAVSEICGPVTIMMKKSKRSSIESSSKSLNNKTETLMEKNSFW